MQISLSSFTSRYFYNIAVEQFYITNIEIYLMLILKKIVL